MMAKVELLKMPRRHSMVPDSVGNAAGNLILTCDILIHHQHN